MLTFSAALTRYRCLRCPLAAPQRYGSAYLLTSISLSVVSFSLSYALVSAGVDVAGLLEKARGPSTRFGADLPLRAPSEAHSTAR